MIIHAFVICKVPIPVTELSLKPKKDTDLMARSLHQVLRKAGLPLRGVHALRHTFAIGAIEAGMDLRTLSEILGHAQVALTVQLYAHSTMETKRDVMEKMDVFL